MVSRSTLLSTNTGNYTVVNSRERIWPIEHEQTCFSVSLLKNNMEGLSRIPGCAPLKNNLIHCKSLSLYFERLTCNKLIQEEFNRKRIERIYMNIDKEKKVEFMSMC